MLVFIFDSLPMILRSIEASLMYFILLQLRYLYSPSAFDFIQVLFNFFYQITLSFNIRSVGKNKSDDELTVGDRFLQLFLHSIGVILTSVQETEMK